MVVRHTKQLRKTPIAIAPSVEGYCTIINANKINMKCIYCKQEHPDNFIFCPMTGFRIVWDNNSKIEEREVFEYQRHLASFVPMGGMFHRQKPLFENEEKKERGRRAVIFALENKEQFASIMRRSKSYDDIVSKIMYYFNFDKYCAQEIAAYRYILLGLTYKKNLLR